MGSMEVRGRGGSFVSGNRIILVKVIIMVESKAPCRVIKGQWSENVDRIDV